MRAIIMCGGRGSRISQLAGNLPKNLLEIQSKSILEFQLNCLELCGFEDVYLIAGYGVEQLDEFVKKYTGNLNINIIHDLSQEGTGKALSYCEKFINDKTFLIMGDLLIDFNFKRMLLENFESDYAVVCHVHPSDHVFDSDSVLVDSNNNIESINFKTYTKEKFQNLTLSGIFLLSNKFKNLPNLNFFGDFTKNILVNLIDDGIKIKSYKSCDFVKDIGTVERFNWSKKIISSGKFGGQHYKRPAIFLDRDGTINKLNGYIKKCDDLELLPKSGEGIRALNQLGYLVFITTNQPIIARGELSINGLSLIHNYLEYELASYSAFIDEINYCPHHPDAGFDGEIIELKLECNCRKPKYGMIEKLCENYSLDFRNSWVVGDSWRDEQLAKNINLKFSKITNSKTNYLNLEFNNLFEFATYLKENYANFN